MSGGNGKLDPIAERLFNNEITVEAAINENPEYVLPFIFGTEGEDTIYGTNDMDWIFGGEGRDRIFGGDGNDLIKGEGGNDEIEGGGGNDRIDGGLGKDHINGGDGDDFLVGGGDVDTVFGGDGNDIIYGDFTDWTGDGEADDILIGGGGDDQIFGRGGDDYIAGNEGQDTIQGGTGNDVLWGEGYEDGEAPPYVREADTFVFTENIWGDDQIMDFDDGLDRIDFSQHQGISGMSDFSVAQQGGDALISYDYVRSGPIGAGTYTSTITLVGMSAGDVDQADFIF